VGDEDVGLGELAPCKVFLDARNGIGMRHVPFHVPPVPLKVLTL
jgi:hypothetical protein